MTWQDDLMILLDEISPRGGGQAGKPARTLPPLPGPLDRLAQPPPYIRAGVDALGGFVADHLPRTDWKAEDQRQNSGPFQPEVPVPTEPGTTSIGRGQLPTVMPPYGPPRPESIRLEKGTRSSKPDPSAVSPDMGYVLAYMEKGRKMRRRQRHPGLKGLFGGGDD